MTTDRKRIDVEEWSEKLRDCAMSISSCVERKDWSELWEELPTLGSLARKMEQVRDVLCRRRGGPWTGWHNEASVDQDAHTRLSDALSAWAIPVLDDPDKWEFDIHALRSLDGEGGAILAHRVFDNPAEGRRWVSWAIKEHSKFPCAVCGGTGDCPSCEGSGFMGGAKPEKYPNYDENSGLEPCPECLHDKGNAVWGGSRACAACGGTALEVDVDLSFERFTREKDGKAR